MYKTVTLPLAKQDIRNTIRWYNKQQSDLGKRFYQEVNNRVNFLKGNPKTAAIRYRDVRCSVLNIFPYMIHYSIDETRKQIVISAVLSTSQDSKLWNKR